MNRVTLLTLVSALVGVITAGAVVAGEADVLEARATPAADGSHRFDVTIRHADTGWDHYADAFDVLAPDGTVLGTRVLFHPHVDEQPFTRSLSGVQIPAGITEVTIRAHDKVDGHGGQEVVVVLE
jgi:hypothetical protein